MKEKLEDMDLYFITDSRLTRKTILEDVKSAIRAGVKIIQYREKGDKRQKWPSERSYDSNSPHTDLSASEISPIVA